MVRDRLPPCTLFNQDNTFVHFNLPWVKDLKIKAEGMSGSKG